MTLKEPRRDETRARILVGARELFGRNGFDGTTVREIAERAGLTDAALYYHFKSKREILQAIWEQPVGGGPAQIRPDGPLTVMRLREILESILEFTIRNRDFLRLVTRETLAGDETAHALRQQNRAYMRRTFYDHLITITDSQQAEIKTEALIALVFGSTLRRIIEHGPGFVDAVSLPSYRERLFAAATRLAQVPAGSAA